MYRFISLFIVLLSLSLYTCQDNGKGVERNNIQQDSLESAAFYQKSYEISNSNPDSGLSYAQKSLRISNKNKNKLQIANALSQIGYVYAIQRRSDSSAIYYQLSADKYLEIGDTNHYLTVKNNQGGQLVESSDYETALRVLSETKRIGLEKGLANHVADAYMNLGLMEDYKGNVDSSFTYYKNALDFAKGVNDTVRWIKIYNNIGVMFYYASEYNKAVPYFQKTISYNRKKNNIAQLADNYLNLGVSYDMLEKNDSAYFYLNLAQKAANNTNYTLLEAKSHQNIGSLLLEERDTLGALENFQKALLLKRKIGETQSLSNSYRLIAQTCLLLADTIQSRVMLDSAILAAIAVKSKEQIKECYELYVEYYKQIGDFKRALEYQVKKEEVKDSLFDLNALSIMYGLEVENSVEEKERDIKKLGEREANTRLVFTILFFLLLVGIYLLSRYFKSRQQQLEAEEQRAKLINKELIHRVNGQFTITEWYLDLKEINNQKKKTKEAISDIRSLIEALSTINKELTENKETPLSSSLFHIKENLKFIASELVGKEVDFRLEIKEVNIANRDIIYLCALFNELTMNSIKYAFEYEEHPLVVFQVQAFNDEAIQCDYHDNGLGYNPQSRSTGQGLGIIEKIVDSLGGEYYIETGGGFKFSMNFRKTAKHEQ